MTQIISIGIDLGTTTTQVIISKLTMERKTSGAAIPEIVITEKNVIYQSKIHFTPLTDNHRIDFEAVKELIDNEYILSGFKPEEIHTGAVIITGETARKENAQFVIENLAEFAGDFVVSTAGPDLEAVLAGYGSGCHANSKQLHGNLINFDIGGGTTNAAIFFNGELKDAFALDIGGRLIRFDNDGTINYIAPRIIPLINHLNLDIAVGNPINFNSLSHICHRFAEMFLELIGASPITNDTQQLFIQHNYQKLPVETVSFSGGVAEFIYGNTPIVHFSQLVYNDIGPLLGYWIQMVFKEHQIPLIEPAEKIRATVIGAGSHTLKLSGSTITCFDDALPLKNIPVIRPFEDKNNEDNRQLEKEITEKLKLYDEQPVAIAFQGHKAPGYYEIKQIAEQIVTSLQKREHPIIVVVMHDFAKALGQTIANMTLQQKPVICLDRIDVKGGDYIDIGRPVSGVIPVIVKTLVFNT